jgi:hypothetical protein
VHFAESNFAPTLDNLPELIVREPKSSIFLQGEHDVRSRNRSSQFSQTPKVNDASLLITMGCGDEYPSSQVAT